jgi:hypothetical protein
VKGVLISGKIGNQWFHDKEQSVFAVMSGTRHIAIGYPIDLNRTFNRHPEKTDRY